MFVIVFMTTQKRKKNQRENYERSKVWPKKITVKLRKLKTEFLRLITFSPGGFCFDFKFASDSLMSALSFLSLRV